MSTLSKVISCHYKYTPCKVKSALRKVISCHYKYTPSKVISTLSKVISTLSEVISPLSKVISSQRAQYPLTKQYSLNHNKDPFII